MKSRDKELKPIIGKLKAFLVKRDAYIREESQLTIPDFDPNQNVEIIAIQNAQKQLAQLMAAMSGQDQVSVKAAHNALMREFACIESAPSLDELNHKIHVDFPDLDVEFGEIASEPQNEPTALTSQPEVVASDSGSVETSRERADSFNTLVEDAFAGIIPAAPVPPAAPPASVVPHLLHQ